MTEGTANLKATLRQWTIFLGVLRRPCAPYSPVRGIVIRATVSANGKVGSPR